MKTWEEFVDEQNYQRIKGIRPGEEGFSWHQYYIGAIFKEGVYDLIIGPDTVVENGDFTEVVDCLCTVDDYMTALFSLYPEVNFSESFPQNEQRAISGLVQIASEREHLREKVRFVKKEKREERKYLTEFIPRRWKLKDY